MRTCEEILERNRRHDAQWRGGLTNHLSMAVLALDGLGADSAELEAFASAYERNLEPLPARVDSIDGETWKTHLGELSRYPDLLARFDAEVAQSGTIATVEKVVPSLAAGVTADAFHPLIRLAYGLDFQSDGEVAAALAYWAAVYKELPVTEQLSGERIGVREALELLRESDPENACADDHGLITPWLHCAAQLPVFGAVKGRVSSSLEEVAALARAAHTDPGNFATLHAVTATHAARVVFERAPTLFEVMESHFLDGIVAVFVISRYPHGSPDASIEGDVPGWTELAAMARKATNDHAIKLTYTCREEATAYGADAFYRSLAYRQLA